MTSLLPKSVLVGLLLGGALIVGAGFGEGLYLAASESSIPFWSFAVNASALALWAPVGAIVGGLLTWCWAVAVGGSAAPDDLRESVWRWVAPETAEAAAGSGAALIAAVATGTIAVGVTLPLSEYALVGVRTPMLRVGAVVVIFATALVLAGLFSPLFFVPVRWTFRQVARRIPNGAYVVAPATLACGLGLFGVAGAFAVLGRAGVAVHALPFEYPAAALGALAGVAVVIGTAPAGVDALKRAVVLSLVGAVLFALPALIMPAPLEASRTIYFGRPTLAGVASDKVLEWTDFDDDGSSNFYGGGDCRPFDPEFHPMRFDEPGNGIDENCNGVELDDGALEYATGPKSTASESAIERKPNIVFITTDALSFGRTTLGGHDRDTTPELADWASDALVFESAFSLASSTRFAWPGMLASRFNSQVPLEDDGGLPYGFRAGDHRTLVETLDEAGYKTVFVPGDTYFSSDNWGGIDRGFDQVDMGALKRAKTEAQTHTGGAITGAAKWYLDRHSRSKDGPLFLWVHYYDHHAPYRKPPEGKRVFGDGESNEDLFDSELRWADGHWGELMRAIRKKWDRDEYLAVFTSDHGESFDRFHQNQHHGYDLRTSVLHVPLVLDGLSTSGRRVEGLVSHGDILPTVADLIGEEADEKWVGESLVPVVLGGAEPKKEIVYSLHYVPEAHKRDEDPFEAIGARTDEFYFVENVKKRTRRLVRWREDPVGIEDVYFENSVVGERLRNASMRLLEDLRETERGLTVVSDKSDEKPN